MRYVVAMDQTRVAKDIFGSKPEGSNKVGMPWLRRLADVENDLREMKVKRLKQKENNREEYTYVSVVKKAEIGP
jgi:hypothetical protein